MDAIDIYQDSEYRILDDAIKHAIKRSACDAVRLGHLLRRMMEEKLWVGYYDSLDSYLRQELHMDYSMACRFEAINRKYSVGGRSGNIDEKWEDYSQGVLIEMLNMSPELEAKVTPDMTVRQVREIKRQARREKQKRKAETETVVAAEGEAPEACSISAEVPVQETDPLTESEEDGNGAEAFPAKDEVPDAEYRELDPVEELATSQLPELGKPDRRQSQYLDDFAEIFITSKHDWMLADFEGRVMDVTKSPEEIRKHLGENEKTWYFSSGKDKAAHINMFDGYVQLWDGRGNHMGDFDWFYLAASIQRMWNDVSLEMADRRADVESCEGDGEGAEDVSRTEPDDGITDELAEVKRILAKEQKMLDDFLEISAEDGSVLENQMFKRQTVIVEALTAMACRMEETEAGPEPEGRQQPPLPLLKNNDQRKEWLESYKDWGLWYRDDNIGVDYYKYDFENGARLIVEVYQEEATRYYDAHESRFLHLVGGPEPQKGQHRICKWQRHKKYTKYPNSETELVEFLKELQKKGGTVQ